MNRGLTHTLLHFKLSGLKFATDTVTDTAANDIEMIRRETKFTSSWQEVGVFKGSSYRG